MSLPNIIQQINSKLPLSGGTMTGNINWNKGVVRQNGNSFEFIGDKDLPNQTSFIACRSAIHPSESGWFYFGARNEESGCMGICKPDGTFTWGGKNVITSAGGTITGNLIVSSIQFSNKGLFQSTNDAQYKSFTITSENTWSNEVPFILMRKIDATNGDKGTVYINAGNGTTYSRITLNADSSLNHDGRPIVSVTKWISGTSGYRKYADGFIEQWGRHTSASTATITLPLAFSNTNYNLSLGGGNPDRGSWNAGVIISTTQIKIHARGTGSLDSPVYWYACGY